MTQQTTFLEQTASAPTKQTTSTQQTSQVCPAHDQAKRRPHSSRTKRRQAVPRHLVVFVLSTAVGTTLLTVLALYTNPILSANQRISRAEMYERLGRCYLSSTAKRRPLCDTKMQAIVSGPGTVTQIVLHGFAVALVVFVALVSFSAWILTGLFLALIAHPRRALRWALGCGSIGVVGTAALVNLEVMKPAFLAVGLTQAMGLVATAVQFLRTKGESIRTVAKTVPPRTNSTQPTAPIIVEKTSA